MPQAIPAIVEIVEALLPTAWASAAVVIVANVIVYGAIIGGTLAYSSAQARKAKEASSSGVDTGRSIMVRDPVASREIVYGQVLKSGSLSFFSTAGSNNQYLYLNVDIADHECEELGDIYFDSDLVPLDGSGNATGKYAGYARVFKFLGFASGERDLTMESELPLLWDSSCIGCSVARVHVRLTYNPNLFTNGYPNVQVLVKGKKLYDWRTATTVYSNNAALVNADFLMDPRFGKKIPLARIVSADVIEAANISDETIVLVDSTTEPRYAINGVVAASTDPDDSLASLQAAMAGCVCDPGGKWSVRAGAWRTPTLTFTDDDFSTTSTLDITPRMSRADSYNGVMGQFLSPINLWAAADFPAVKNDTYEAWDGGVRLWKTVVYNFTTSSATVQRLAKIDLERGRQQIQVVSDYKLKAIQAQPGDVIMITRATLGWTSKPFEVVDWTLRMVQAGGGPCLVVNMTLRETAEGVWDWADGEETAVDLAPNTDLWDASDVETPTGLTLSTSNWQQPDGTTAPRLELDWTLPTDTHVQHGWVEIYYKKHSDSVWINWLMNHAGISTQEFITDVQANIAYDVKIRYRNERNVNGAYEEADNYTVVKDTTAPATPTGLSAAPAPGGITLDWDDNTESDLGVYDVFRNTANSFSGSSLVNTARVSNWTDHGVVIGTTYYYWIVAVDRTGNSSSPSTVATSSPSDPTGPAGPASAPTIAGPDSVDTTGNTNSWTDIIIMDSFVSDAGARTITMKANLLAAGMGGGGGGGPYEIRVLRNSSTVVNYQSAGGAGDQSVTFTDTPGAGPVFYKVQVQSLDIDADWHWAATISVQ